MGTHPSSAAGCWEGMGRVRSSARGLAESRLDRAALWFQESSTETKAERSAARRHAPKRAPMAHDLLRVGGMTEGDIDLTRDPPDDVDSCRFGATDHLAITRLAPGAPHPRADLRVPRFPALFAPPATPSSRRDRAPVLEGRRSEAPSEPRTSFWRALLRPTTPSVSKPSGQRALDLLFAVASSGLGLVAIAIDVLIGVHEDPSDPTVSAAVVVAHALLALGLVAFGITLLGIAKRRLTAGDATGSRRTAAQDTTLGRQQERTG
jgi:hypothetical protein